MPEDDGEEEDKPCQQNREDIHVDALVLKPQMGQSLTLNEWRKISKRRTSKEFTKTVNVFPSAIWVCESARTRRRKPVVRFVRDHCERFGPRSSLESVFLVPEIHPCFEGMPRSSITPPYDSRRELRETVSIFRDANKIIRRTYLYMFFHSRTGSLKSPKMKRFP